MKDYFVASSLKLINSKYNYNQDMIDRVKYGLEIIYITITKISIVFIASLICKTFRETITFFCFISFIKFFSYGIHAKKSWQCYIVSLIIFILFPNLIIKYKFNIIQEIILCFLSLISMILYAPSDTYKRPLVNKKHRKKLKTICILITIIYSFIIILSTNQFISNLILLALLTQSFCINPIIYKIFKMPYNNYKLF